MKLKQHGIICVILLLSCRTVKQSTHWLFDPPPGTQPSVMAPGFISQGLNERDGCFAPDNQAFYFSVWTGGFGTILVTRRDKSGWSIPEVASFSGVYSDVEPFISPDGKQLFFASNRPLQNGDSLKDYDIWMMKQTEQAWDIPQNLGTPVNTDENEFYPTVSRNGTLCFTGKRNQPDEDIFLSRFQADHYEEPVRMPETINTKGGEFNAFLAPDEQYIIFTAWGRTDALGRGDLYVSFRDDGGWTHSINMGPSVNSTTLDYCPGLTPDGKTFIFTSSRSQPRTSLPHTLEFQNLIDLHNSPRNGNSDIYLISSSVIDSLGAQAAGL